MKSVLLLVLFGLVSLLSLSTLSSCTKEHDEKNLPVEEVLPFEDGSGSKPDKSGVGEEK